MKMGQDFSPARYAFMPRVEPGPTTLLVNKCTYLTMRFVQNLPFWGREETVDPEGTASGWLTMLIWRGLDLPLAGTIPPSV